MNRKRSLRRMLTGVVGTVVLAGMSLAFSPAASADPPPANLLINGDFATPAMASGTLMDIPAGSGALTGWTVWSGSVDLQAHDFWSAPPGSGASSQSVDLGGFPSAPEGAQGTITQTIATTAGTSYTLSFDLAGNVDGVPAQKTGDVTVNGVTVASLDFNTTGHSEIDMGWVHRSVQFTATGATTTLRFESTTTTGSGPIGYGPVLANVSVTKAPSGDWGTAGSGTRPPGQSGVGGIANMCYSAGGCSYGPNLVVASHASNGGSFSPGTTAVTIEGVGQVGTCQITTTDVTCTITQSGHVPQGAVISTYGYTWQVSASAPPEALVFNPGTHVGPNWVGNDPSNDVYPLDTPPEIGAPMADWTVAGGIGGVSLLLGGGYVLARRRKQTTAPATS